MLIPETLKAKPADNYKDLKRQFLALKKLCESKIKQCSIYSNKLAEYDRESILARSEALESEKEMNAQLTEELAKANERVKELEKELKESEDDLDAAEQQLSSYENALEEVQAVFVDSDACPLFEPFNPRNLSAWLNKFAIAKKVEALDEVESVYMQAAETSEPISFREAFDAVEEQLRKEQE